MNLNKFDNAIIIMSDMIRKNQKCGKKNKVFPVACVVMNENEEILFQKMNEKGETGKNEHHAEFIILEDMRKKINTENFTIRRKLIMFVTIPPCEKCYKKISNFNSKIKWKIFYLNDDIRNKMKNNFWNDWKKQGHGITKLYISRLSSKESILRLFYCIDIVIERFALHKNAGIKNSIIVADRRKNHKQRMKIFLDRWDLLKGK